MDTQQANLVIATTRLVAGAARFEAGFSDRIKVSGPGGQRVDHIASVVVSRDADQCAVTLADGTTVRGYDIAFKWASWVLMPLCLCTGAEHFRTEGRCGFNLKGDWVGRPEPPKRGGFRQLDYDSIR
jgi:hypothetical protein